MLKSNLMIRHITLTELNNIKEKYNHTAHSHRYENVFLFSPGQGLLNARAYKLCNLCGEMVEIQIDDKMGNEINNIISKKLAK